jgi:hypothetical protein
MNNFKIIEPKRIKFLKEDAVKNLRKDIEEKRIFGIGEVHGVADNADLYFSFIGEFGFEAIALEYPVECLDDLMKFLETGDYPKHWFFHEINDGRFSHEMLSMLKALFDAKKLKKVICYDKRKDTTVWNERDQDYADAFAEQYDPSLKTLIIGGGHHIKTEPFEVEYEEGTLYPMCYHLKQKYGTFPTSEITYTGGEFYNFEKQQFADYDFPEEEGSLIKADEDYKYHFILRNVKAVSVD